jgi:hypothetical protein
MIAFNALQNSSQNIKRDSASLMIHISPLLLVLPGCGTPLLLSRQQRHAPVRDLRQQQEGCKADWH